MEKGGEQDCGTWPWSQTAAIKSSSRGNASLKLRAHILVVGHMQFLCVAPASASQPLLVEESLYSRAVEHLFHRGGQLKCLYVCASGLYCE